MNRRVILLVACALVATPFLTSATALGVIPTPSNPQPPSGSIGQAVTGILSWSDPNTSPLTTYDVDIGTTLPPSTRICSGIGSWMYCYRDQFGALQAGTTYYWRVTGIVAGQRFPGEAWMFTTSPGGGGGGGGCGDTRDLDGDGLIACLETSQGTTDDRADFDGDALSDYVEAVSHPDRNAIYCGPSACAYPDPLRKDLYVQMDYMGTDHLPPQLRLDHIKAVFTNANEPNPDGTLGIRMHLDAGPAYAAYDFGGGNSVAHVDDFGMCGGDWTQFQNIKNTHFAAVRQPVWHYMIWAHGSCGTSSGISRGAPASDFIVSLGAFPNHGTELERVGTFVHELGHNLALRHGGNDDVNYKPNYLSVMNYLFQLGGIPWASGGPNYFGYSDSVASTLTESSLNENTGIGSNSGFKTKYYCGNTLVTTPGSADSAIDWNCNGQFTNPVSADINRDGSWTSITGYRDWRSLVYNGGLVGHGAAAGLGLEETTLPLHVPPMDELDAEEAQAMREAEEGHDH